MSRTNSAPSSPIIGSARTNSPRMNRSFRGEKDIGVGELANRMRRMQGEGYKNRRDDKESDDEAHYPMSSSKKGESSCCGGHAHPAHPTASGNMLSIPNSPRSRSKSPGTRGLHAHGSPSLKRPTSLLTASNAAPRSSTSPRASPSPSPRASPARKISTRGMSPNKSMRSPATPTKSLPGDALASKDLNDPDVLARIGNRAVKTVNKPTRSCDHCKRDLTDDGCTAFGKVYHKDCFRCHGCKKKLDGKFFSKDENAYCAKCHKANQEQCSVCKEKIVGDCVVNNNTYYHPGCMKCHVCDEPLKGSYFFFQNKPICEKDFKETQQICSVCEEVIEGTYYQLNDQVFCEKDYMAHMDKCGKCDKEIEGKVIRITGSVFHPDCFTCETCDTSMVGQTFSTDDKNKIYCPDDYTRKFAALCSVCSKPIVPKEGQTKAPRIRAMDKDFHPPCFKCEDCNMVLDSRIKGKECWPIRHHVLCYKCNRRRQSESESESD